MLKRSVYRFISLLFLLININVVVAVFIDIAVSINKIKLTKTHNHVTYTIKRWTFLSTLGLRSSLPDEICLSRPIFYQLLTKIKNNETYLLTIPAVSCYIILNVYLKEQCIWENILIFWFCSVSKVWRAYRYNKTTVHNYITLFSIVHCIGNWLVEH